MTLDAEALSRELLDAWNDRDVPRFLALMHDDVTWYDAGMPKPPAVGREPVRRFAETMLTAFPDFRYTIREPVCVSNDRTRCVFPRRIEATHSGWMVPPGLAPTAQRLRLDGVDILDSRDGKIQRIETYFDPIPAVEQLLRLNLRLASGSVKERIFVWLQRSRAAWLRRFHRPTQSA